MKDHIFQRTLINDVLAVNRLAIELIVIRLRRHRGLVKFLGREGRKRHLSRHAHLLRQGILRIEGKRLQGRTDSHKPEGCCRGAGVSCKIINLHIHGLGRIGRTHRQNNYGIAVEGLFIFHHQIPVPVYLKKAADQAFQIGISQKLLGRKGADIGNGEAHLVREQGHFLVDAPGEVIFAVPAGRKGQQEQQG